MSISELSGSPLFWNESLAGDLLRFLTGRLRCAETAADLTHETYIRLDNTVKQSPPENVRALAFHIASNLANDYQRKMAVRNRYASSVEFDSAIEIASDQSTRPDRILMARQQLILLQKALNELPVNCRTAFYLHSKKGLTYSEIAVEMGISKPMVNKLLSQAMAYCALQVQELED